MAVTLWGVFAAHTVSYWLTNRAPESRARLLAESGHSYWDLALPTAIAGLAIALVASVFLGWTSQRSGGSSPLVRPGCLVVMNVAGFVSMELVERLISGSGPQYLFTEPVFWVGIAASIVAACINALLLRGAHRVGEALSGVTDASPCRHTPRTVLRRTTTRQLLLYVCWTRGPPLPSLNN